MTVASLFLMSGATASAFALAWKITTASPADGAASRAQVVQAATPPAAQDRHISSRRGKRAFPPAWTSEPEVASPPASAGPSIALSGLGSPTHAPDELWARAVKLASAGVDVILTESSLAHRPLKDLEHELGPSARIHPSTDLAGIRIASLAPGSIARAAGLQQGDVITAINGHALASPADLLAAYSSVVEAHTVVVELRRGPHAVVLRLRMRT